MRFYLPPIFFLKLHFMLSSFRNCTLPKIKGSMLRGAFGHALKKTVCIMPSKDSCISCLLRSQCAYTRIFESFVEKPPPLLKGVRTAPRPFVIDAFDEETSFPAKAPFSFTITLFGNVCDFYPYVIYGIARAAESGFSVHRHPFFLEKVEGNGVWIYDGERKILTANAVPQTIENNVSLTQPVTLQFLTPTRIKQAGRFTTDFTFRRLVFAMLKRHLEMTYFYMPDSPLNWNFKELLHLADKIRFSERKLYWVDWTRYSNRQKSKLNMGGFCGRITLEGDIEPFSELLRMAEVLHVGKGTTLGMGKVRVEYLTESPY